ncbi:MAG: alanine racemase [Lachnospiraceae bacterium]|jgi:alanine racemase|nr:alanine racemase [Lachnospiraceae bacterium]
MEDLQVRPSELIVSIEAIKHNINEVKNIVGKDVQIMPTIKANAYGMGIKKVIEIVEELKIGIVAVAIADEGIVLRNLGYKGEIFVLNQPYIDEIEKIAEYSLTVGISSMQFIQELGKNEKNFKIHLEIGTGMGRTGIKPVRCSEVLEEISKYKNILVEGIYTHFSCSDSDEEYTKKQIKSFEVAIDFAKKNIPNLKYIHACNSAGVISFPEAHYNLVRPGLMIYGYLPEEGLKEKVDVMPCCKLKSKVSFIKEIEEGFAIGYGKSYITQRKSVIATIPIGYADGVRRVLSNAGKVVINGALAPIVGSVCMDSFMADVTEIPGVLLGTDVYIWDNEKITLEEVAKRCDTINYEIISTISARVKREYV